MIDLSILRSACADAFDISQKELKARNRRREIVIPRQIFCYLAYKSKKDVYSPPYLRDLGWMVGIKHSNVLHAHRVIESDVEIGSLVWFSRREQYVSIKEMVELVREKYNGAIRTKNSIQPSMHV